MQRLDLPKQTKIIIDDKIVLEPVTLNHTDELFSLTNENRDYLKVWLPWVPMVRGVADTRWFVDKSIDDAQNGISYVYMIMVADKIVGCFDLRWIDLDNDYGEIGYWLGQTYQGQGIVGKCVNAMTQYAFDTGMKTMGISCAAGNTSSQNVAKHAGYIFSCTKENAEQLSSGMVDHYVYLKTDLSENSTLS